MLSLQGKSFEPFYARHHARKPSIFILLKRLSIFNSFATAPLLSPPYVTKSAPFYKWALQARLSGECAQTIRWQDLSLRS